MLVVGVFILLIVMYDTQAKSATSNKRKCAWIHTFDASEVLILSLNLRSAS